MATSADYMDFVCQQIKSFGQVRYRKMFGEYLAYLNDKPILLVCDNSVFVKKLPGLEQLLADAPCGVPYPGAREHYQLDIEDAAMLQKLIPLLEQLTPLPVKKSKSR